MKERPKALKTKELSAKTTRRVCGGIDKRLLLWCSILVVAGLWLMLKMPSQIAAMEEQRKYDAEFYEFAELFSEVYSTIRERYVEEVDSKQLFEGAIKGMFDTLDPHSSYLPPRQQADLTRETEGEYSGVGLHITLRDGILTVISPIEGSPAAQAGVISWDRIIEIDGKTTEDIELEEAVDRLTGPTGTSVQIKVWREGETRPLDFTLTRAKIKVESVFHRILTSGDDKIGVLRIAKFQDDTANSVEKALKDFNDQKVKGVIVDLRNDAGGLLDRAVEICDMFLPKGQIIVSTKGRDKSNNREYYSENDPLCTQPMIVMVNKASASASEIFAGAMKDTGRGLILGPEGKTTFGKGSVQTISPLRHSLQRDESGQPLPSGIRLTTAKYYTPSGVSIHEKGIEPDLGVSLPPDFEINLLRHGLMGDPSLIEAKTADQATTAAQSEQNGEDSETQPQEDQPSDHLLDKLNNGKSDQAAKGQWEDLMLKEAVKYLKAILIYQNKGTA